MGEDGEPPVLGEFPISVLQGVDGGLAQGFVACQLLRAEVDFQRDLRALRQVVQHVTFQPTQQERGDEPAEILCRFGAVFGGGGNETALEGRQRAKKSRVDEAKEIPQFRQVIFHGRSRHDHLEISREFHDGVGTLGVDVFDGLGFVEDDGVPADFREVVGVILKHAVGRQKHVERTEVRKRRDVGGAPRFDGQRGREFCRFIGPVTAHRRGRHHQRGALRSAVEQQRQGL